MVNTTDPDEIGKVKVTRHVVNLIIVSMLFSIFTSLARLLAIRGNLSGVLLAFIHPGEAYHESQRLAEIFRDGNIQNTEAASYSWAFRISTVFAVLNGIYIPLAVVCWSRLAGWIKGLFLVALFCTILFTVGVGAQSGIGYMLFAVIPVALWALFIVGRPLVFGPRRTQRAGPARLLVGLLMIAGFCSLVAIIAFFQVDRAEAGGRSMDAVGALGSGFGVPSENGIVSNTGSKTNYGLVMTALYLSHGYEGLALAMEQPFEWTYGLSWSGGLQALVRDYLGGPDMFAYSYVARSEQATGWRALAWWSTIFPWIASDTTYYGTVFVTILIGFVMARCWFGVIATGNPIGFAMLGQLFTLVFMFPANNALAQSLAGFFSLVGVSVIYIISIRRFGAVGRSYNSSLRYP